MFRDFKWIVHKKFDRNHTCFTKPGMQTQRWFSHVEYLGQAVQGTHCPSWQELPISHVPQTWVAHPLVTSPHTFSCAWQTCGNCSSGINGLHSGAATMKEVVSASHQTSCENSVSYFQEDTWVRRRSCCSHQIDFRRSDLCSRTLSWGSTRTDQSSTHPNINSCRDKSTMVLCYLVTKWWIRWACTTTACWTAIEDKTALTRLRRASNSRGTSLVTTRSLRERTTAFG